jgi:hypothetical protein
MNKKNLIIALTIIIVFLLGFYLFSNQENPNENNQVEQSEEVSEETNGDKEEVNGETSEDTGGFISCLAQADLLVYGMEWCPACQQVVASLGGYDTAAPIYVECTEGRREM